MTSDTILDIEKFLNHFPTVKVLTKYDSTQEEKIPHEWWNLNHARIQQLLRDMSKTSTQALAGMANDDVELRHLYRKGDALDKVQRSKTYRVVLSGPQGAGKSSFLNSLLDCPGMCHTAADGRACTNSIVIYFYYQGTSDDAFFAEVKFHAAEKIQELIDQHSRDYYHFYHFDNEISEMTDAGGKTKKSFVHDELDVRAKDTAEDIFETLFGGKDKFHKAWSQEGFLNKSFQNECERKCAEAISKVDKNTERIARYVASTPEQSSSQIGHFKKKTPNAISLWPLVDTIRYGLDREILKQGLEFIDLPGWGDRNIAKTRHADEIKDTADLEIFLINTSRITTENIAISNIRVALQNRGPHGVIIVPTKIDAIPDHELAQCKGASFDKINGQIAWADEKMLQAVFDGEDEDERDASRSKEYLKRERKCEKVIERCASINAEFKGKFTDLIGKERVKTFQVSSADYLKWIIRDKIPFLSQPALPPNLTGIPEIRKYLYQVPASCNLRDLREQVPVEVNSLLGKIDRVVTPQDRSEGFKTLAAVFRDMRNDFIRNIEKGIRNLFRQSFEILTIQDTLSNAVYRQNIDDLIEKSWLSLYPYGTFNKILRENGYIAKGVSRARCLAEGCDWNLELSAEFNNHLGNWKTCQDQANAELKSTGVTFVSLFFQKVIIELERSNSDVCTISTGRAIWMPYKNKILSQVNILFEKLAEYQTWLFRRGTMADGQLNSLVPSLMVQHFRDIHSALPALSSSSTETRKIYVEGKFAFQKKTVQRLLMGSDVHIFDQAMGVFYTAARKKIGQATEDHILSCTKLLGEFSQILEELVPSNYQILPQGEIIRNLLRELLPLLREQALELQSLVPFDSNNPDHSSGSLITDMDLDTYEKGFTFFLDKASAAKPSIQPEPAVLNTHIKKKIMIKQDLEEGESIFVPMNLSTPKKSTTKKNLVAPESLHRPKKKPKEVHHG